MQQARQACPFFQLEQRAVLSPVPRPLELSRLQQQVIPELRPAAPLSVAEQQSLAAGLPAWIVEIESSFGQSSPELLTGLRQAHQDVYLIARDLVMDEYQILQARTAGADALILSNALLGPRRTQLYAGKIRFWDMEPVLEVHCSEDIRLALELKLRLIMLAPPPGRLIAPPPELAAEAGRLLGPERLLILAAPLAGPVPTGIGALAPGASLWAQPDPAAELARLGQLLSRQD